MSESFIFSKQLRKVKEQSIHELSLPKLFDPQLERSEANIINWDQFESKMKPLSSVKILGTNTECIITPKSTPWAPQDVNIYVGGTNRDIFEIKDLSDKEGEAFFNLNFYLAKNLLSDVNRETHVSIGFNPDDFSQGHHSVQRLHSHVYVADGTEVEQRIESVLWDNMDKDEKLTFIEPFSQVYYEYITYLFQTGKLDQKLIEGNVENNVGYVSLYLDKSVDASRIFHFIKTLYEELKNEYAVLLEVFTNKKLDTVTQRYIPRPIHEREVLLGKYLADREGVFSQEGKELFRKLAQNLKASTEYLQESLLITKGLAGAFTFSFEKGSKLLRVDFLPRVLSTSTVDRTLLGKDRPTKVKRAGKIASVQDLSVMEEYHKRILELVGQVKNNNILG